MCIRDSSKDDKETEESGALSLDMLFDRFDALQELSLIHIYGKPFTLWYNLEEVALDVKPEEKPREFHFLAEEKAINRVSFMVLVPEINIPEKEFVYMLSFVINTYKVAGKTYLIKIDQTNNNP